MPGNIYKLIQRDSWSIRPCYLAFHYGYLSKCEVLDLDIFKITLGIFSVI